MATKLSQEISQLKGVFPFSSLNGKTWRNLRCAVDEAGTEDRLPAQYRALLVVARMHVQQGAGAAATIARCE